MCGLRCEHVRRPQPICTYPQGHAQRGGKAPRAQVLGAVAAEAPAAATGMGAVVAGTAIPSSHAGLIGEWGSG